MKKTKKYIIGFSAVFLILLIVVAIVFFSTKNKEEKYLTQKAGSGSIRRTVSTTGTLESQVPVKLNFEISGRLKNIKVQKGQKVAQGELIALIEDEVLTLEADKAKAALDKALAQAGANDDLIREAQTAFEGAKDYREELEDVEDQKVESAKEAYEQAKNYYQDTLDYYNEVINSSASASEKKMAKMTLTQAKNQKEAAKQNLEIVEESKDLNEAGADNEVELKEEKLKTAESEFTKRTYDSNVQTAKKNYQIALSNLEKASLKAPVNGKITKINFEKGEIISSSVQQNFGELISEDFIIISEVAESDIALIEVGQSAELTFDAFDLTEKFNAQVVEIDPASTVIQDVVYYKVKLRLKELDQRIKPGMSSDIDIQVAEKSSVLKVPQRAVEIKDSGQETVKVFGPKGRVETRNIKTGLAGDEGSIEVIEGLSQGEEVIVSTQE
ncbi:MAG: efflux RND transporter periplasmic adaptor subunit [Candidatus Moranbacteria bacterium]|nr:efflux RND transporter periplasmic adaptor subunit [Candidatus Moranbacteria bacterium]